MMDVANSKNKEVNAHYALSCLTEDIIGKIALGVKLNRQLIPEEENTEAKDRDVMLKEVRIPSHNIA